MIIFFFFFWLRWVLVAARRIFVEACGIFHCDAWALGLFVAGRGLLSSCVCRFFSLSSCGAWAPECVGSVVVVHGLSS